MNRKILYVAGITILIATALGVMFITNHRSTTINVAQKCPDDYADTDAGSAEYLAATDEWTNAFFDTHPGASLLKWARARHQFLVDNNCTAALQRYQDAKDGKTDPVTMEQVKNIIQEELQN